MSNQCITLRLKSVADAFFLVDSKEKEEMTFSEFLSSVGLKPAESNFKMSKEERIYQIVDEKKWVVAILKYGF